MDRSPRHLAIRKVQSLRGSPPCRRSEGSVGRQPGHGERPPAHVPRHRRSWSCRDRQVLAVGPAHGRCHEGSGEPGTRGSPRLRMVMSVPPSGAGPRCSGLHGERALGGSHDETFAGTRSMTSALVGEASSQDASHKSDRRADLQGWFGLPGDRIELAYHSAALVGSAA